MAQSKPSASEGKSATQKTNVVSGQPTNATSRAPITYMPPDRGAPARRVNPGSRGRDQSLPLLRALTPDHVGLTTREQPVLLWYLSATTAHPITFSLVVKRRAEPILEVRLNDTQRVGVNRLALADYKISLQPDVDYQWFIAISPDEKSPSQDLVANGAIKLVSRPALAKKLSGASERERPALYANSGIWHDAVASLYDLMTTHRDDAVFREQFVSLLDQVGLSEVRRDLVSK